MTRVMAGGFAGRAVLERPTAPAVIYIHIHKLERPENPVSPCQVSGEGAISLALNHSPRPLSPTATSSPKVTQTVGRGGRHTPLPTFLMHTR